VIAVTIPDDFPTFAPVARLDTEQTKRIHDNVWQSACLQAQADMAAMEHEHEAEIAALKREYGRNCIAVVIVVALICLAIPARLVTDLITKLFGP
jgi:hypothetical protein